MPDEEDNVRIDPRLCRIGLQAIAAVAEKHDVEFYDLTIEQKKSFLTDYGAEIIELARTCSGKLGRYFEDRVVMLVENGDAAGLYFVKKGKDVH